MASLLQGWTVVKGRRKVKDPDLPESPKQAPSRSKVNSSSAPPLRIGHQQAKNSGADQELAQKAVIVSVAAILKTAPGLCMGLPSLGKQVRKDVGAEVVEEAKRRCGGGFLKILRGQPDLFSLQKAVAGRHGGAVTLLVAEDGGVGAAHQAGRDQQFGSTSTAAGNERPLLGQEARQAQKAKQEGKQAKQAKQCKYFFSKSGYCRNGARCSFLHLAAAATSAAAESDQVSQESIAEPTTKKYKPDQHPRTPKLSSDHPMARKQESIPKQVLPPLGSVIFKLFNVSKFTIITKPPVSREVLDAIQASPGALFCASKQQWMLPLGSYQELYGQVAAWESEGLEVEGVPPGWLAAAALASKEEEHPSPVSNAPEGKKEHSAADAQPAELAHCRPHIATKELRSQHHQAKHKHCADPADQERNDEKTVIDKMGGDNLKAQCHQPNRQAPARTNQACHVFPGTRSYTTTGKFRNQSAPPFLDPAATPQDEVRKMQIDSLMVPAIEQHQSKATDFFVAKQYSKAAEKFGTALELAQQLQAHLLSNRATALMMEGFLMLAVQDYQECLILDPSLMTVRIQLGSLHLHLGSFCEAEKTYREILKATQFQKMQELSKNGPESGQNVQLKEAELRDQEEAQKCLQDVKGAIAQTEEAMSLADRGWSQRALIECQKALLLAPLHLGNASLKAQLLVQLRRCKEAVLFCNEFANTYAKATAKQVPVTTQDSELMEMCLQMPDDLAKIYVDALWFDGRQSDALLLLKILSTAKSSAVWSSARLGLITYINKLKETGNILFHNRKYSSAAEKFGKALRITPPFHRLLQSTLLDKRAESYMMDGFLHLALKDCQQYLLIYPFSINVRIRLGRLQLQLGFLSPAMESFEVGLKSSCLASSQETLDGEKCKGDMKQEDAWFSKPKMAVSVRQEMQKCLSKVVDAQSCAEKASKHMAEGNSQLALVQWEALLLLAPLHRNACTQKARVLANLHRWEAAVESLETSAKALRRAQTTTLELPEGGQAEGVAQLGRCMALKNAQIYVNALRYGGRESDANAVLEACSQRNLLSKKKKKWAVKGLAKVRMLKGLKDSADNLLEQKKYLEAALKYGDAFNKTPSLDVQQRALLLGNRAIALMLEGFLNMALEDCKKCLRLNPDLPKVRLCLGQTQLRLSFLSEAETTFKKVLTTTEGLRSQHAWNERQEEATQIIAGARGGLRDVAKVKMVAKNAPLAAQQSDEKVMADCQTAFDLAPLCRAIPDLAVQILVRLKGWTGVLELLKIVVAVRAKAGASQITGWESDQEQEPELLGLHLSDIQAQAYIDALRYSGHESHARWVLQSWDTGIVKRTHPEWSGQLIVPNLTRIDRLKELRDTGKNFFRKRAFWDAEENYSEAIRADPLAATAEHFTDRAAAYMALLRYDEAVEDCNTALLRDPSHAKANFCRAQARLKLGLLSLGMAKKVCLLKDAAKDFEAYLGMVMVGSDGAASAKSQLRTCLNMIKTARMERLEQQGYDLYRQHFFQDAIEKYGEALRVDLPLPEEKNYAPLLCKRALAFIALRRYNDAVQDCCQALSKDPNWYKTYLYRARAWKKLDKLEKAMADYKTYIGKEKNLNMIAKVQEELKQVEEEMREIHMRFMVDEEKSHYEILGLNKSATSSEVKQAYRKLSLQFHPDKNKSEYASVIFLKVKDAYDALKDPDERRAYDNKQKRHAYDDGSRHGRHR